MKVSLAAITICAILSSQAPQAFGAPRSPKLEGMGYLKARKIILGYGWKPASDEPCEVDKAECARFPEISSCSGVDPGYCAMTFANQARCLYLTTSGGEPHADHESDTHVIAVTFRPCAKN